MTLIWINDRWLFIIIITLYYLYSDWQLHMSYVRPRWWWWVYVIVWWVWRCIPHILSHSSYVGGSKGGLEVPKMHKTGKYCDLSVSPEKGLSLHQIMYQISNQPTFIPMGAWFDFYTGFTSKCQFQVHCNLWQWMSYSKAWI